MKNVALTFLTTALAFTAVALYGFTSGRVQLASHEADYVTTLASAKR